MRIWVGIRVSYLLFQNPPSKNLVPPHSRALHPTSHPNLSNPNFLARNFLTTLDDEDGHDLVAMKTMKAKKAPMEDFFDTEKPTQPQRNFGLGSGLRLGSGLGLG